jgi:SAM-dependent methyltransferase
MLGESPLDAVGSICDSCQMAKTTKLGRARAKLERKLADGWQRAVFATPEQPDGTRTERVLETPLPFGELFAAAEAAAAEGLVKQTFIVDATHRIELDARHGHIKQRVLDEPTLDKIMGGKDRALRPDRSAALLRAIGIMNPDQSISARNAKKYKQVNHLVELCRPVWAARAERQRGEAETDLSAGPLRILDLACGNSYLSFVLLEALRLDGLDARLLGVDVREDVIANSRTRAEQLEFADARFVASTLESLEPDVIRDALGGAPQLVISLHACDTATDAALALAIRSDVEWILCVPCCQAELARQLDGAKNVLVPAAVEHGLLRRSFGELLTDALRVEVLEACGYEVAVVEFVASSHTPKNLLLRARRARAWTPEQWRLEPIRARCRELGVDPALLRALA